MSRIKIQTLQSKVEFIILALGGKPDADKVENSRYLAEFDGVSTEVKQELQKCRALLGER